MSIFLPLAFETLGLIYSRALVFLKKLGRRLNLVIDDKHETVLFLVLKAICSENKIKCCMLCLQLFSV